MMPSTKRPSLSRKAVVLLTVVSFCAVDNFSCSTHPFALAKEEDHSSVINTHPNKIQNNRKLSKSIKQEHGGKATEKASKKNKSKSTWSYKSTKSNPDINVVLESSQAAKSIKAIKSPGSKSSKKNSAGEADTNVPTSKSVKNTKSPKFKSQKSVSSGEDGSPDSTNKATKSPKSKSTKNAVDVGKNQPKSKSAKSMNNSGENDGSPDNDLISKSQKTSKSLKAKSKSPKATKSPGPEDWSYKSPKNHTKSPKATKSPKNYIKSSSPSSTPTIDETSNPTSSPTIVETQAPTPSSESDVSSNPTPSPTQQDNDTIIPFTDAPSATPSAIETFTVTSFNPQIIRGIQCTEDTQGLDDAEQTTVQFNYEISVDKMAIDDNEEVNKILDNLEAAIISHLSQVSGCKADRNLREAKRRHLQLMKMEFLDSRNIAENTCAAGRSQASCEVTASSSIEVSTDGTDSSSEICSIVAAIKNFFDEVFKSGDVDGIDEADFKGSEYACSGITGVEKDPDATSRIERHPFIAWYIAIGLCALIAVIFAVNICRSKEFADNEEEDHLKAYDDTDSDASTTNAAHAMSCKDFLLGRVDVRRCGSRTCTSCTANSKKIDWVEVPES